MRAEALKRALTFVSRGPVIQFPSQIADLSPQQTRRAITTAALEFNYGRGDFDNAGVEINCTARGQLKRFARYAESFAVGPGGWDHQRLFPDAACGH